jgi:ABC-type spermidine/putrescine transport system permease subunit I
MTTLDRARDWKVTTGYRMLLQVGWGALALSLFAAASALVIGVPGAWWMAAGLALVALLAVAALPDPVPAEMITGRVTRIDPDRLVD